MGKNVDEKKSQYHSELYFKVLEALSLSDDEENFKLSDSYQLDNQYVQTGSRSELVETVLTCIDCNMPILIEGIFILIRYKY